MQLKDPRAFAWLIAVLAAITGSQSVFRQLRAGYPSVGPPVVAVLVAAAAVAFIALSDREKRNGGGDGAFVAGGERASVALAGVWRTISTLSAAFLLSGVLAMFVLWRIPFLGTGDSFEVVILAWCSAILLFMFGVARPPGDGVFVSPEHGWSTKWSERRATVLSLGSIVLFSLLLRTWSLGAIPFTLGGDEASQGLEALRVIEGQIRNPFSTGWLGVPTMSFFYGSFGISALGRTAAAVRLPWALIGTATVPIVFLLVREIKGMHFALGTAAALATYHYHVHFSRLGSNQVADPFFMALSLYFFCHGINRQRRLSWALAGGVAGLAFYFYAGARLTGVVLLICCCYSLLVGASELRRKLRNGILTAIGGFVVVALPMLQYAVRFPDDFNARLNQVGIIQSGWLAAEMEATGKGIFAILADQFCRAALAFNYYPDRTVWYGLDQPLLGPLFGTLFLVGLGWATIRSISGAEVDYFPMVAWWWSGMILGGMMTESPPSTARLVTLSVPAVFFIVLAISLIAGLFRRAFDGLPVRLAYVAALCVFSGSSLYLYFLDFTPKRLYGGKHAQLATHIAPTLQKLTPDHSVHFVGAPWMHSGFPTLRYLVPGAEIRDVESPLTYPLSKDLVTSDRGAVFVVLPEREEEVSAIEKSFPNGQRTVHSTPSGAELGVLYVVPPSTDASSSEPAAAVF